MKSMAMDRNPWKFYAGKGKQDHKRKWARGIAIASGKAAEKQEQKHKHTHIAAIMDVVSAVSGYISKMVSAGDTALGSSSAKMKILLLDSETVRV
ncbi:MAG: hypothetical protein LQ347_003527 [Umbilicaria vellea]|nr:MAG: hypothetical protein LQ347_003527 [Umbilicaria vellea]